LAWAAVTGTAAAWWLHALAIWIWHVPPLFVAALADPALHVLQHACFLGSALLFWRSVVRAGATRRGGGALFSVFTTMLYTGALGALLTFAREPWYVSAAQATLLGLTPLEDQQLGGLLMWVPGGVAYLVAGLWIVAAWLAPPWREAAPMASATVETRVRFNDSPELHA
jgi:cytochrome c oxidase assembly factor CtaG